MSVDTSLVAARQAALPTAMQETLTMPMSPTELGVVNCDAEEGECVERCQQSWSHWPLGNTRRACIQRCAGNSQRCKSAVMANPPRTLSCTSDYTRGGTCGMYGRGGARGDNDMTVFVYCGVGIVLLYLFAVMIMRSQGR
jgi:hypothetical protein